MYVVFRIVDSDYDNAEIMALCSDVDIAINHAEFLIAHESCFGNVMYAVGCRLEE